MCLSVYKRSSRESCSGIFQFEPNHLDEGVFSPFNRTGEGRGSRGKGSSLFVGGDSLENIFQVALGRKVCDGQSVGLQAHEGESQLIFPLQSFHDDVSGIYFQRSLLLHKLSTDMHI